MIDIHCHILPKIDDGARDLQETLEMCRMAVADGITTIVATPHQQNGVYNNTSESILGQIETLKIALKEANISLEILPGADVYIDVNTVGKILQGKIMTINDTKRYFLLEFPAHTVPPNIEKIIDDLLLNNIIPVLTHPERILEIQENPLYVYELVSSGVLSQITAMSLTGGFGRRAKRCAKLLLQHNLVHVIASDAHSIDFRPPILSKAVRVASRLVGEERAIAMVTTIPQQIIRGEPLPKLEAPLPIKRRFWSVF